VRRLLIVILALAAITAVMVGPMVNWSGLATTVARGDARQMVWTMAWEARAVRLGLPMFQSNVYYPDPDSLQYNEHIVGMSLFGWPIIAGTGNAVLAYNVLFLLAWVLNGLGAWFLARRFVGDPVAAFVGCLVYAFSCFRVLHASVGHLPWAWTFWLPLSILAWDRWYREPTGRRTAVVFVVVMLQALTSWYLAIMVALTSGLWLLCLAADARRVSRRHVAGVAAVAAATALVLLPFAWHYRDVKSIPVKEAAFYSASVARYVVPPYWTTVGSWLLGHGLVPPVTSTETLIFPGWVMWGLAAVGAVVMVWPGMRRRWLPSCPPSAVVFFPLLAGLALLISLGPSSNPCHCASPYDWFVRLPLVAGLRSPARFALLVILAMSVLAAAGAAAVHKRLGRKGRVITAVLVVLALAEAYPVRLPRVAQAVSAAVPDVYRNLAQLPPGAVVSLPDYFEPNWASPDEFLGADYVYYSTFHWHPVVNGYGSRSPKDYGWILNQMMAFAGPHSAETMRRLGIRYVVLHATIEPEGPVMLREALGSPDFERIMYADGVHLFRVLSEDERHRNAASRQ